MGVDGQLKEANLIDETNAVRYGALVTWFNTVLGPDASYYWLAMVYGIGISILTLALPISVQMLIDTVANTALWQPVLVLSLILFFLLLLSGLFVALRAHVMELFSRRIYARLTAEIALRAVHAQVSFFTEGKRDSLFNRFFDIMVLQTNVPSLLTGAFTLILQALIGFVVVSLYHPYLLIFNLLLIGLIFIVWMIWSPGAIRTAIDESYAKYDTAQNLEGLAENNDYYRAEANINRALSRADTKIRDYIRNNRRHFRYSFSQICSLLFLYAAGSALLLGIGGWLVIQGQLTLGQLVAAELIMSAILLGISQFGFYLDQFYEVCAAVEKLSVFFNIPLESDNGTGEPENVPSRIEFDNVEVVRPSGQVISLSLDIPPASKIIVRDTEIPVQRSFLSLLQAYERPIKGWIRLAGTDLCDIDNSKLRSSVMVFDRTDVVECTIDSYLTNAAPNATAADKAQVLEETGLKETVARVPNGMGTKILPSGWPLSPSETLRLKLAAGILKQPRVIVLTEIFDLVERRYLNPTLERLARDPEITLIRFTDDDIGVWASHIMVLRADGQLIAECPADGACYPGEEG